MLGVSESPSGQGLWGWAPQGLLWGLAWAGLPQVKPGPGFSCLACVRSWGWGEASTEKPLWEGHSGAALQTHSSAGERS